MSPRRVWLAGRAVAAALALTVTAGASEWSRPLNGYTSCWATGATTGYCLTRYYVVNTDGSEYYSYSQLSWYDGPDYGTIW